MCNFFKRFFFFKKKNIKKGYFGKGEFSRGEPSIKKLDTDQNQDELSINFKNLIPINETNFEHKKNLLINTSLNEKENTSFDAIFKAEFIQTKIQTDPKLQYFRLNTNEKNENFFKSFNNPFNFKIKSLPSITLKESLSLMYEEVKN